MIEEVDILFKTEGVSGEELDRLIETSKKETRVRAKRVPMKKSWSLGGSQRGRGEEAD